MQGRLSNEATLKDVTPAQWKEWYLSLPANTSRFVHNVRVRRVLLTSRELTMDTREAMRRQAHLPPPTETAYSLSKMAAIAQDARRVFGQAERRIRENLSILDADDIDPPGEKDPFSVRQILLEVARTGDVPRIKHGNVSMHVHSALGGHTFNHLRGRLFLSKREAWAAQILLCDSFGWNYTTIEELEVPNTVSVDGTFLYHLKLVKRRRGGSRTIETQSVIDDGPQSTGRLITRIMTITAPGRALLSSSDPQRLIVWRPARDVGDRRIRFDGAANPPSWAEEFGYHPNFRRMRKTYNVLRGGGPNQNTEETHNSVYVLPEPASHVAAEATIAAGISDVVSRSRDLLARIAHEDTEVDDTAVGSCLDYDHSPFSEEGLPCQASFLMCFGCPNAVIMPRHLPRITFLLRALLSLAGALPPELWESKWRSHFERIQVIKLQHVTAAKWEDASRRVTERDREIVNRVLMDWLTS